MTPPDPPSHATSDPSSVANRQVRRAAKRRARKRNISKVLHAEPARRFRAKRRMTRLFPIEQLTPDPGNARRHSGAQIRKIARAIELFGFNAVLVVDAQFKIVVGHARYEALKLLGETHAQVIVLDDLTPDQIKAYAIADNRLSELSSWDEEALARSLKELSDIDLNFEIEATGFDTPEIATRIQSLDGDDDGLDLADDFDRATDPAVTQPGQMWRAGEHTIAQGDARDPLILSRLVDGEEIAASFADPPYNVPINGHASGLGRVKHRDFAMAVGEMSKADFTAFLTTFLVNARNRARKGAIFYVCMDWRHVDELSASAAAAECEVINICVYVKSSAGMGAFYRSQHELVFVLKVAGASHVNNVQLGRFGRNRTNAWHYPSAGRSLRRGKRRALELHPTPKPVRMVADAILDCTNPGDLVLDPFLGAGATLLACEKTGRRCRAIEIDPIYIDTAIERWQRMTGRQAVDLTGRSFNAIRADRLRAGGAA